MPLFGGNLELQVALALETAEGEGVAVYATEEIRVCWNAVANFLGVTDHLFDVVAADFISIAATGSARRMSYPVDLHPVTKPSRVNSPIDGDLSSSAIPRQATSSNCT